MTKNIDAIRRLFGGRNGAGNLPSLPGIFPDYSAPVVSVVNISPLPRRWPRPWAASS